VVPQRAIVALDRDSLAPVRVTVETCESPPVESSVLDYVTFEQLPATPANLEELEMSPHPGVPVVDGIEIDKAEKRDDDAAPPPTPTPTP
jgi:hypothetical protein